MHEQKKCSMCYGFGWWFIGVLVPIGELDYKDMGQGSIQCPWCGCGDITEDARYRFLVEQKERMDKELAY